MVLVRLKNGTRLVTWTILLLCNAMLAEDYDKDQILRAGLEKSIPCHNLQLFKTWYGPGEFTCNHPGPECTTHSGFPIKLLPFWFPTGAKSIEFRNYPPGALIFVYPLSEDTSTGKLTHWVVYRGTQTKEIISLINRFGKNVRTNWSVLNGPKHARTRELMRLGRVPIGLFDSRRFGDELHTPYYVKYHHLNINIPNKDGLLEYNRDVDEEAFHYERCDLVGVYSLSEIVSKFNLPQAKAGWGQDCHTTDPDEYSNPNHPPTCMANAFGGKEARKEGQRMVDSAVSMIPIVGTGYQINHCWKGSEDPFCWGEAAITGITDIATLVIPFTKLASGAKYAKSAFAYGSNITIAAIAITGQSVLAARDFSEGNLLAGTLRIAASASLALILKPDPIKGMPRKYKIVAVQEDLCDGSCGAVPKAKMEAIGECSVPNYTSNVRTASGCCTPASSLSKLKGIYNLSKEVDEPLFFENIDKLMSATSKIEANPKAAIEELLSLGEVTVAQQREISPRQWGALRISQWGDEANGLYTKLSEENLQNMWTASVAEAEGYTTIAEILFRGKIRRSIVSEEPNRFLYGFKKSLVRAVRISLPGKDRMPMFGATQVFGEKIVAQEWAKVILEEWLHGAGGARLTSGKGIQFRNPVTLLTEYYVPHTKEAANFHCWLSSHTEEELRALIAPSRTIPGGMTYKELLNAQMMEADIAIWLKKYDSPMPRQAVLESYEVRKFLAHWYENVMGKSYFDP